MKDSLTTAPSPVIEAKDLNLVFETNDGPVHALKDVNLTINKGDFVSFITALFLAYEPIVLKCQRCKLSQFFFLINFYFF